LIDNSLVEKLPPVEYEFEDGQYEWQDDDMEMDEPETITYGATDFVYHKNDRPMTTLDEMFTKQNAERLLLFPHTRTMKEALQFTNDQLAKELDLTVVRVRLEEGGEEMKESFLKPGGQCNKTPYKREIEKLSNDEGRW
jgi:hypothetical protein